MLLALALVTVAASLTDLRAAQGQRETIPDIYHLSTSLPFYSPSEHQKMSLCITHSQFSDTYAGYISESFLAVPYSRLPIRLPVGKTAIPLCVIFNRPF